MLDDLGKGEEFLVMGISYDNNFRLNLREVFSKMHEIRIKKDIRLRALTYEKDKEIGASLHKEFHKRKLAEYRILPFIAKFPVETVVYKDNIAMLIREDIPAVIRINNKKIADDFRNRFEHLWVQAKSAEF